MSGLVPWIVVAALALVVLRLGVGLVKSSLRKLLFLAVLCVAGFGWLWWQSHNTGAGKMDDAPGAYSWPAPSIE